MSLFTSVLHLLDCTVWPSCRPFFTFKTTRRTHSLSKVLWVIPMAYNWFWNTDLTSYAPNVLLLGYLALVSKASYDFFLHRLTCRVCVRVPESSKRYTRYLVFTLYTTTSWATTWIQWRWKRRYGQPRWVCPCASRLALNIEADHWNYLWGTLVDTCVVGKSFSFFLGNCYKLGGLKKRNIAGCDCFLGAFVLYQTGLSW